MGVSEVTRLLEGTTRDSAFSLCGQVGRNRYQSFMPRDLFEEPVPVPAEGVELLNKPLEFIPIEFPEFKFPDVG